MKRYLLILFSIYALLISASVAKAQCSYQSTIRPPATPLVTADPYFAIWSMADHPAADTTRHWTQKAHPLVAAVKVDGKAYRILGVSQRYPSMAECIGTNILPTRTIYTFACGGIKIDACYEAPVLLDDPDLLARPVNYITWQAVAIDGKAHNVEVVIEASPRIAIDKQVVPVIAEKGTADGIQFVRTGTVEQPILAKRGDDLRIDWGYFYLAAPEGQGKVALSRSGKKITSKNFEKDKLILSYTAKLGKVDASPASSYVMLAYDDIWSIEYLGKRLRPWWNRTGTNTITAELAKAAADKQSIDARCDSFDSKVCAEALSAGGSEYADLCALAYRQAVTAHKLVAAPDGSMYFISKENNSNGCAGTVDVTYPSIPLMLLYNNDIAKATIDFVFDYCQTPAWKDKRKATWATHDIGVYPQAYGQHYGSHMALEECGNMLLLTAAVCAIDGNASYARKHWEDLTLWTLYMVANGMNPENQLCTDDFAGKLAHNVNLSAKCICGIAAYAKLAAQLGKTDEAKAFRRKAEEMARKWKEMAADGDHYKLTFDKEGTWSQKYNLVWDQLLGLNVFDPSIAKTEINYYQTKFNKYGLPLDSRKAYTKTDWILWTATMAPDDATFRKFISPVWSFYNETIDRLPMGDWVDTDAPTHRAMYARSVVGGFYMKMLADRLKAEKK